MQQNNQTVPFLRWAGGKRWLSRKIAPLIQSRLKGCYIEPFLGAGAMFFAVAPKRALLSDLNTELINCFQIVKNMANELVTAIRKIPVNAETYYKIRSSQPGSEFNRAINFLYLNRTCYGGLYRENKKGKFNTPYGGGSRTPEPLWGKNLISKANQLLSKNTIQIKVADFAESMKHANKGDVVYCDPTYSAVTRRQFDRYGSVIFDWNDQERLASEAKAAYQRGALVLISNAHSDDISSLYADAVKVKLKKSKTIGNRSKLDDNHQEYLIIMDPDSCHHEWSKIGKT